MNFEVNALAYTDLEQGKHFDNCKNKKRKYDTTFHERHPSTFIISSALSL